MIKENKEINNPQSIKEEEGDKKGQKKGKL